MKVNQNISYILFLKKKNGIGQFVQIKIFLLLLDHHQHYHMFQCTFLKKKTFCCLSCKNRKIVIPTPTLQAREEGKVKKGEGERETEEGER